MKMITTALATAICLTFIYPGSVAANVAGREQPCIRHYGRSDYRVLDSTGFFLYSCYKLVRGEKISRLQTVYYFSLTAKDPVKELTLVNVENAFAGNTLFRYMVDRQFRSDTELIGYDPVLKMYKIKYLYSQSLK